MEQARGLTQDEERHQAIEVLAYRLWEQRGQPWGEPEMDWFRAERELLADTQESSQDDSSTVTAAKVVGSVLGSITGIVTAITGSFSSE